MAQKPLSEFLLTASGIQHRVPRRTDLPHPAFRRVSQTDPQVRPTAHLSSARTAPSATAEPLGLGLLDLAVKPPGSWSLPQRSRSQVPSLHRHYPASSVLRTCPPPL